MPDQQQAAKELIDAAVASAETTASADIAVSAETSPAGEVAAAPVSAVDDVVTAAKTADAAEVPPTNPPSSVSVATPAQADTSPPVSVDASPVGLQTIASAYRDCTRKSLEEARSYVEKLSGVRSLDKAVEVQAEFAKHTYENFVADSWKIRGLYSELFKQMLKLPGGPSR